MSRRRIKIGEAAQRFSLSFCESEYQEVVADSEQYAGGNISRFFRNIYQFWKLYRHLDRHDMDKQLKDIEKDLQRIASAVESTVNTIKEKEEEDETPAA
jgi:hypothetical protein